MARSSGLVFFALLVVIFAWFASSTDARKLLNAQDKKAPSLYLVSLPKGKVPASTPSKRGHATTIDQKLIARHLAAIDRILRSVPSPGVGH